MVHIASEIVPDTRMSRSIALPYNPRIKGTVQPAMLSDARPGSPLGDEGWQVMDDSMAPAIEKYAGVLTHSGRTIQAGDEVVVVLNDGRAFHRVLGSINERNIVLQRYMFHLKEQRWFNGGDEKFSRADVRKIAAIVGWRPGMFNPRLRKERMTPAEYVMVKRPTSARAWIETLESVGLSVFLQSDLGEDRITVSTPDDIIGTTAKELLEVFKAHCSKSAAIRFLRGRVNLAIAA